MTTDPNDFLMAGGVPACKFPTIGTTAKGTIVASQVTQQTDIKGTPKTFDDGNPMQQVVITLQTDLRDPAINDDQGLRKLYVKGQMQAAIRDALRAAGARLEAGGILAVQYESDKPAEKVGFNATKIYRAQYVAPSATAANDLLGVSAGVPAESLI